MYAGREYITEKCLPPTPTPLRPSRKIIVITKDNAYLSTLFFGMLQGGRFVLSVTPNYSHYSRAYKTYAKGGDNPGCTLLVWNKS